MRALLAILIVCAPPALAGDDPAAASDFPPAVVYTDHDYYGPYDDEVLTRGTFCTALGVAILLDDPIFDGDDANDEDYGYEVGLPKIRTKPVGGRYLVDSTG